MVAEVGCGGYVLPVIVGTCRLVQVAITWMIINHPTNKCWWDTIQ